MLDLLIYSFRSILANKTRSFLTMLGIIVGITSMMIISVSGRAFTDTFQNITERLYKSDKMTVSIVPSEKNHTYVTDTRGNVIIPDTVYFDVRKVNEMLKKKDYSNAYLSTGNIVSESSKAIYNGRTGNILIWSNYAGEGSTASTLMRRGREISLIDNKECSGTAVISDITERDLFGEGVDSIGKTILIQSGNTVVPVVVVGIYEDPLYSLYNASFLYVNHSYLDEKTQIVFSEYYWQRQELVITMDGIEDKVRFKKKAMSDLNSILGNDQWEVAAITETESLETLKSIVDIILDIVFVIACLSLFIGSLGLMSIMIITVAERTNEIGIRKAIGASNVQIMLQFLCESLTLSSLGTGIGILLGMIMSKIASIYAADYLSSIFQMMISVNVVLPIKMMIGAVLSAFLIGIVFGIYPAFRGSRMQIVDSLRAE